MRFSISTIFVACLTQAFFALLLLSVFRCPPSTQILRRDEDPPPPTVLPSPANVGFSALPHDLPNFERLNRVRDCISKMTKLHIDTGNANTTWSHIHTYINRCGIGEFEFLNLISLGTEKIFLPLANVPSSSDAEVEAAPMPPQNTNGSTQSAPAPCVVLTLGIGQETNMEQILASRYPGQCRFYGADPTPGNSDVFHRYGTYYPIAVDDVSRSEQLMSLLDGGGYKDTMIRSVGLEHFMRHSVVNESLVHFMSMDVEGAEYRLLALLARIGRRSRTGTNDQRSSDSAIPEPLPPICQIAIECHGGPEAYKVTYEEFGMLIYDFVAKSDFVPIRAFSQDTHHRFLVVNSESPECLQELQFTLDSRLRDASLMTEQTIGKDSNGSYPAAEIPVESEDTGNQP